MKVRFHNLAKNWEYYKWEKAVVAEMHPEFENVRPLTHGSGKRGPQIMGPLTPLQTENCLKITYDWLQVYL